MRNLLLPFFLLLSVILSAQDTDKFSSYFANADAVKLASHLNSSVEINIPDNSGIYQKKQAQQILQKFFDTHTVEEYEKKHEGGSKQKSRFHIGTLKTDKGNFRTYLLYNSSEGMMQIIELRIEEE